MEHSTRRSQVKALFFLPFLFLVFSATAAHSWDFMERPAAVVLSPAPEEWGIARAGYFHSAYRDYRFRGTRWDQFHVEAYGHHSIFDAPAFRLGIFYGTYMLNGPVNDDDIPGAAAAQWMMNAIQYEYGFLASWEVPVALPVRMVALGEYSRRSYHPLRSGIFEDPAADILRTGVAVMDLRPGRVPGLSLDSLVRFGWTELYDFWGASSIRDPRARYTVNLAAEVRYDLPPEGVGVFLLTTVDVLALRAGGLGANAAMEGGIRIGGGLTSLELYLDFFHSEDTEQLREGPSPATLFGFGTRFVMATR